MRVYVMLYSTSDVCMYLHMYICSYVQYIDYYCTFIHWACGPTYTCVYCTYDAHSACGYVCSTFSRI